MGDHPRTRHTSYLARSADQTDVVFFRFFFVTWCVFPLTYSVAFEWSTGFVLFSISSHSQCVRFSGIFWPLLCTHTHRHAETETTPTADTGMYGWIQLCTTVTSTLGAPIHIPAPSANYRYTNALLHTHMRKEKKNIDKKRTNTHTHAKENTNA